MLVEPAKVFKGILKLSEKVLKLNDFDTHKSNLKLLKFVPASELPVGCSNFECFLNEFDLLNETINGYINKKR
jgi:hypothetical protein